MVLQLTPFYVIPAEMMAAYTTVDIQCTIKVHEYGLRGYSIEILSKLGDYPWIKDIEHLKRVNKYRKRHGQFLLNFTDNEIAELALLT